MSSDPIEVEYPLTFSPGQSLAAVGCVVVVTFAVVIIAAVNARGLRIAGIISLSVEGATIFYWAMAAGCGFFVLPMVLAMAWRAHFLKQRIAFTRSSVWLPRSNWTDE